MRWTYDFDIRALHVYLSDSAPERQVVMADGTIVDVDSGGEGASTVENSTQSLGAALVTA